MMNFFTKWFVKAKPKEKPQYEKPKIDCSSMILLSGPAYGDKTFFGSFLLNAVSVREWALDHSKGVWSSANLEQQARVFLPVWLDRVTYESEGYITLIDMPMRQVLVPYTYDFSLKGWLSIYCHQCHEFYDSVIDQNHDSQSDGISSKWIEEWHCPVGHILHLKEQEVRWIVRKRKKD